MAEDLSAEIRVGEIPPKVRLIQGVATSTFAIVGVFEKGPIGKATFISGPEEFKKVFGRPISAATAAKVMQLLYANGGSRGYITRTAHYTDVSDPNTLTAIAAFKQIDDRLPNSGVAASGYVEVANNAIEQWVRASGYVEVINNTFDAGDKITINGEDIEETVDFTPGVDAAATALAIRNAINANLVLQGIVTASIDPGNSARVLIQALAWGASGNAITLAETDGATDNFNLSGATLTGGADGDVLTVDGNAFQFGNDIAVGANAAATADNIRVAVNALVSVNAAIAAGNTSRVLITAAAVGLAGNAIALAKTDADNDLTLSGATLTGGLPTDTQNSLLVTADDGEGTHANGRIIRIAAPRNGLADHFKFQVVQAGVILDTFDDVNLTPGSANYIETRVNGKQEKLVRVVDQLSSSVSPNNLPALGDHALAGGVDGLVGLADSDFIGSPTDAKTGLYSWDKIEDKFALSAIPDRPTPLVQQAAWAHSEAKKHHLFIGDLPDGLSPQDVVAFKNSNGYASEYLALYYPWFVMADPTPGADAEAEVRVPNSAAIIGICARTDNAAGKGVAKAPAGINDGRIFGIKRTGDDSYQEKGNRDLVFPEGINPIWSEQGVGVIVDGARLSKLDGLVANVNERRVFIYCETSIKLGIRFARHENIDEALFNALNASITAFLVRFWRQGGLKGKVPSEAFYVNTEFGIGTINPPSEEQAGRVNVEIGLATKKPAYFITVNFTVDQRALLEELSEAAG